MRLPELWKDRGRQGIRNVTSQTFIQSFIITCSGGSLADTSQSASPCRQPSPKKRIAPSPSPDDSNISQNNQTR